MEQKQFSDAEMQVIERAFLMLERVVDDDMPNARIELGRTMALIYAKNKPLGFVKRIIKKAGSYADRV